MAMLHSLIARRRFGPQTQWRPLRKTLTNGLGLDDTSLAWPAVVLLLVFIYSFFYLFFILDSRLAIFFFFFFFFFLERNSPLGFLLVVFWMWCRCFKCVFFPLVSWTEGVGLLYRFLIIVFLSFLFPYVYSFNYYVNLLYMQLSLGNRVLHTRCFCWILISASL